MRRKAGFLLKIQCCPASRTLGLNGGVFINFDNMKEFTENGFYIQYPDSWTLEEDAESNGETINLQPLGDCGFFSLSRYPSATSPEELAEAVLETIRSEYEECEVSPARESYGTHTLAGYDVDFFCLDFSCTITIRTIQHSEYTYVIYTQRIDTVENHLAEAFLEVARMWVEHLVCSF